MSGLTHLNERGEANMVDVGAKPVTQRHATAESFVTMTAECLSLLTQGGHPKGDVFAVARIAGIQAAKKCSDLIPLCHPLQLSKVGVVLESEEAEGRVRITATCSLAGQTGVEMEALTAASVAALTVYDMCKAVDKGMTIGPTRLLSKEGGQSGDWNRAATVEKP